MTTKIETLRAKVEAAEAYYRAADIERHRLRAALADAEGDERTRVYCTAYADAQEGKPGGHETFMALCRRRDAERILAGRDSLENHPAWDRPAIAAEVERLRSASEGAEAQGGGR